MRRELIDFFLKSAGDFLDSWFESDPIKALYGFDGIVGTYPEPLCAGHRLCAAAPCVRRGERQARRLGPCDRRHGRDHAGDGAVLRRARRRDPDRSGGARGDRRERPRGRRGDGSGRGGPRAESSSPTSIRSCSSRGSSIPRRCRRNSCGESRTGAPAPARSA